jgi:hypothetical protein
VEFRLDILAASAKPSCYRSPMALGEDSEYYAT